VHAGGLKEEVMCSSTVSSCRMFFFVVDAELLRRARSQGIREQCKFLSWVPVVSFARVMCCCF
jgi:hypothetical protein